MIGGGERELKGGRFLSLFNFSIYHTKELNPGPTYYRATPVMYYCTHVAERRFEKVGKATAAVLGRARKTQ